jgi:hypothetical protein
MNAGISDIPLQIGTFVQAENLSRGKIPAERPYCSKIIIKNQ